MDLQGASAAGTQKAQQNSLGQQQKNAEDKEQADALKEFGPLECPGSPQRSPHRDSRKRWQVLRSLHIARE